MRIVTKLITAAAIVLVAHTPQLHAQMNAPQAEAVYGGRILDIVGFARAADTSRIFISTQSANSLFYADVAHTASGPSFGMFQAVPGADAEAGFGARIQKLAVHEASGTLYFLHDAGLIAASVASATIDTLIGGFSQALTIHGDVLLYTQAGLLNFGSLDASGSFSSSGSISISSLPFQQEIAISEVDSSVYIFGGGNTPVLYKLSDSFDGLTGTTSASDISPSGLATGDWRAFGVGPDGRLFLGGSASGNKHIAWSDDEATWSSVSTGLSGVSGTNLIFSGDSSAYDMYFAKGYNHNGGVSGSWSEFGRPGGFETHPNDGVVFVDPIDGEVVYMTTDQGIGASTDRGESIFEINDGVEAVQVRGFDMTSDKNQAWVASKSGIRKVTNYQSSALWTNAIFPNKDGSPYYSAEMHPADTSTVFVGNVRIYKTDDAGANWQRVFTPEISPWNFSNVGTKAAAIEVLDEDPNIVFAGFEVRDGQHGGVFWSADGGANWEQILLEASTIGDDVDVWDIVFNIEGSDTIAYVGVEYDLNSPQGRSVYKLTKSGSSWSAAQDMNAGTTSTGSLIVASIRDLHVSSTGDTIFAAGTDAGINHPIAYYKPLNSTGLWTVLPTSGFPFAPGKEATAVTLGSDTLYCAVDNEIYFMPVSGSSWQLGYSYPVGMRINFLYFDDLLVGTETGLYEHPSRGNTTSSVRDGRTSLPDQISLLPNYPNPFNPSTVIRFEIASPVAATLRVYDIQGRQVAELYNGHLNAGAHQAEFDATGLASGVYVYRLTTATGLQEARKMLLVR